MKKITAFFLSVLLMSLPVKAEQAGIDFTKKLADDIIVNVLSANISDDEKLKIFHDRFKEDLDIQTIGKHVTGVYWRKATPKEQQEFLTAFLDFATKSWADKFNLYTGQKINFTGIQAAKSGQFFVSSSVEGNPPAEVLWRIKKAGSTYKITDIVIEGVSMVTSYRNEYVAFLHKNGGKLANLTQELQRKSQAFSFTKK
ncbi:MAG: ABC transporter substrate-binding protein [Alphaproteobacteria bacterium]|nr:ABC transporter substrate-binding protein [Alphaproteobacteria bacterium]MBR6730180.1 ABC transporter substrate-binding protein [Alphaproteobacteria bacterium]